MNYTKDLTSLHLLIGVCFGWIVYFICTVHKTCNRRFYRIVFKNGHICIILFNMATLQLITQSHFVKTYSCMSGDRLVQIFGNKMIRIHLWPGNIILLCMDIHFDFLTPFMSGVLLMGVLHELTRVRLLSCLEPVPVEYMTGNEMSTLEMSTLEMSTLEVSKLEMSNDPSSRHESAERLFTIDTDNEESSLNSRGI